MDISEIDDIDEYSDMLATKSPYYIVTTTLARNVFRIGTLMEFANQGRYILYQILATDFVLNEDGTLDTRLSQNGGLKLIWRMKQFSSNPPEGVVIGEWSKWSYLSGGGGGEVDAYTKTETDALLAQKQNNLTFDNVPTANSNNPVKSGGVKTAIDAKQDTISTVNVTVDNNTGTPSGSASVSGGTLTLNFSNLKGATGEQGPQGIQGVQGVQGPKGDTGVTGDASSLTIIHGIDKTITYGDTDVCGADAAQALLNEIEGGFSY